MTDIYETIERWLAEGQRVVRATVTSVEQSAPRGPGAWMAVNERGEVAGSVSGGCVEGAVYEEAQDVFKTGRPRWVTYGISDDQAISVGLTCGGTIHIFIGLIGPGGFDRLIASVHDDVPVALATRLDGPEIGETIAVWHDHQMGSVGTAGLNHAVIEEARALLTLGESVIRAFGDEGEPVGDDVRIFIQSFAPRPNMYIFGAIDFTKAMVHVGKYLGYQVTVIDARPIFATKLRFPEADDVVVEWPDEFLSHAVVDERTALVILTHDIKFDVPVMEVALKTQAGYIGAMGSRKTQANRFAELRAKGYTDDQLARISAPIGLDIGARTPEETAISIAGEIIAQRAGRSGGRLTGSANPIHAGLTSAGLR
jgi:xanthine dehydrogenase accessory factor